MLTYFIRFNVILKRALILVKSKNGKLSDRVDRIS